MRSAGIRDVPLNNGITEAQQSVKPKKTLGEIVRRWMPEAIVSISVRNFRSRLDAYDLGGGNALLQRSNGVIPGGMSARE